MKRIVMVLLVYTVVIAALCVGVSLFYGNLPVLLAGAEREYMLSRGILWFLQLFPAVLITGCIVGCTVQWHTQSSEEIHVRFSSAMMSRFKSVFIVSIVLMLVSFLNAELFMPLMKGRLEKARQDPVSLGNYMELSEHYLSLDRPFLAWQYAERAYEINPKDPAVASLYKHATDEKDLAQASSLHEPEIIERIREPLHEQDRLYTIPQLIEKSQRALEAKEWFNAHYWAALAVEACSGTDVNLSRARDTANYAWNRLSQPDEFANEELAAYFKSKKEGYIALNEGYALKAYYIFSRLSAENEAAAEDPDVKKYLALAQEKLETQYFFIDETDDYKDVRSERNLYFSLQHTDGSRDVVYVRGTINQKHNGGMVRYLEGLSITTFDRFNNFVKSFHVPFAKMLSQSTDVFDEEIRKIKGISKDWKSVPYIILQSVDRTTEGIVGRPEYMTEETGIPEYILKELNLTALVPAENAVQPQSTYDRLSEDQNNTVLILPMNYDDFNLMGEAAKGPRDMSLFTLFGFLPKTRHYGFAFEVYAQSLILRSLYPMFMLILFVMCAGFAWKFRMAQKSLFRFSWILMLPLITAIVYMVFDFIEYGFTLMIYVIVGRCGNFAIPISIAVYIAMLIIASLEFLSHKSD